MIVRLGGLSKPLLSIAAVLMLGTALSGCSSVPGWVDPTTWIGGDSDSSDVASNDDADDEGLPADEQPDQAIDDSADTASSDSDQPDLAYIPDRPTASSTPEERQDVADSLAADRSRSRYSSETLRGDTSSPAPQYASATTPASAAQAPAAPGVTTSVAQQDQDEDGPAPAPTRVAMRSTAPQTTTSSTGPAVPANTGVIGAQGPMSTDAALGFEPSKAPPLDASVAQFVPQPIISRFQQTASVDTAVSSSSAGPAVPSTANMASDSDGAVGGPEAMTGAVVANLDALQSSGPVMASTTINPQGMPPSQVVFFPHDTTVLNAEGRQLVRAAAEAYRSRGGAGFVRVVGHSSSRTANMPLARHLTFNFERSQARATAVAKELIRDGIPADKVLVEAVGDSQPVYYESMPQGEEGNRRAEIFL